MKTKTLALGMLLPFLLAGPLAAQVSETNRFTSLNLSIPDGNASGLSQARTVTSAIGSLTSVRVKLHINGQFNGDLYAYLRHIQGGVTNRCILLNRPGRTVANSYGYADAGLDVTFDDSAANDVHAYGAVTNVPAGSPLTGVWQPDGRNVDPGVVLDTSTRSTTLGAFNGTPAGGEWTLFLADMDSGAASTLVSWELEFTGVATPTLTWSPPADIVYGTALSGAQLNAAATFGGSSVPGIYNYTPAAGTVLNAGNSQTLSVTFTPADQNTYLPVSMNVPINVLQAPLVITADNKSRLYGEANPPLTATITGFVNGQNLASSGVTGEPSLSTTAVPASIGIA